MSYFELTLHAFSFPRKLPDKSANFRFVADLRFVGENDRLVTVQAVMPGLDTFWECDTNRSKSPNYVRKDASLRKDASPGFDMKKVDDWDKLIFCVKASKLHSIQFKVFDVDRKDAWDMVKRFLGGIVRSVIGRGVSNIPKDLPTSLLGSLGAAAADVQSFLLNKLAGGRKLLFKGSYIFNNNQTRESNNFFAAVKEQGSTNSTPKAADYKIEFKVKVI